MPASQFLDTGVARRTEERDGARSQLHAVGFRCMQRRRPAAAPYLSLPPCGSDDELDENGGYEADIVGYK